MDFLSRLENMPENERQDWNELDDVSDYLVHRLDLGAYDSSNYEDKTKSLCEKIW